MRERNQNPTFNFKRPYLWFQTGESKPFEVRISFITNNLSEGETTLSLENFLWDATCKIHM